MPGWTDDARSSRPTVSHCAAPVTVFQWAQDPGPVGGVTQSVTGLSAVLRRDGITVRSVDTSSGKRAVRMLPHLWRRRAVHLFHITRLWRATVLAPLFMVLPGRTVVVLHSGSTRRQLEALSPSRTALLRRSLLAYDEVWAVNGEIGAALPPQLAQRVHVISPFVPVGGGDRSLEFGAGTGDPGQIATTVIERDPDLVTVSTNSGKDYYGAELAIEAMALVRERRPGAHLWIMAYGDEGPPLDDLRAQARPHDWIRISFNLTPDEVDAALRRSAIFVRPTTWDGDALIVREALACGARVIASDTARRPAGVELCALDAQALADTVLGRGRVSDGAGLATDSIVDAARAAVDLVRR